MAKAWAEYVKTGAVGDTTPPPAPFHVRASDRGEQGTEITWNADADFESGIRGFLVLRDGEELAKVPQAPVGRFGRPLFQSMTYHDTPAQPLSGDAPPRHVGQARREACLYRGHDQQRRVEVGTVSRGRPGEMNQSNCYITPA